MKPVDFLVVGAGLIGSAVAWHLASAGSSVLLAEARHPNAGASGQNAGSLHFQIERRFLANDASLVAEAAHIARLNRLAITEWAGLEAALNADLHVHRNGGLMVAESGEEMSLLERKVQREQEAGLRTILLDRNAARDVAPYLSRTVIGAAFLADEGHADPRLVTPAYLRAARAKGAEVRFGTRVVEIAANSAGFTVTLDGPDERVQVRTAALLAAANASIPQLGILANLHLPLHPVGLFMNATERIALMLPHLVQHVGRRLSMKQTHAGNILIGGGWPSRMQRAQGRGFDPEERPEPIVAARQANLEAAVATVPAVADLNLLRTWTGVTAVTSDQLPLVGEVPRLPGFFVAGGGSAFTLGPVLARLVASQMLGGRARAEAGDALRIAAPARFEHLNGFMG